MPQRKPIIVMRGSPDYERALLDLQRRTRSANLSEMTDDALRLYARQHGVELPERSRPVGANQHTSE